MCCLYCTALSEFKSVNGIMCAMYSVAGNAQPTLGTDVPRLDHFLDGRGRPLPVQPVHRSLMGSN